jgi:hypothetical protein
MLFSGTNLALVLYLVLPVAQYWKKLLIVSVSTKASLIIFKLA